ncbi:hypothetical protein PV703_15620 [Streptomyces sp. ME01-24h]|nr:hypothetical protein [Streptomyces sp. ME01-24h]
MSRRSHVERGEEYMDGPVVRHGWEDRLAARVMALAADRQDAVDDLPQVMDVLGVDWPAVRTARIPTEFQPGRRQRAAYAALQAPFRPALWAGLAALIAIATTTHLTKPKGGTNV